MKKAFVITILALLIISSLAVVSAETTLIAGKIYNADYSDTIAGADVTVTCNENEQTTESLSDGTYAVSFDDSTGCGVGSSLLVHAYKEGVGDNTIDDEQIQSADNLNLDVNLGVVNVPLVPEFGFFVGGLTIFSAIAVFFFVRRQ